jgi:hypothetical protein
MMGDEATKDELVLLDCRRRANPYSRCTHSSDNEDKYHSHGYRITGVFSLSVFLCSLEEFLTRNVMKEEENDTNVRVSKEGKPGTKPWG